MVTVKEQFDKFLSMIPESSSWSKIQHTEMRKAFYAGFGQSLVLLRDEIAENYDEEAGAEIIQGLWNEVAVFWAHEAARHKA